MTTRKLSVLVIALAIGAVAYLLLHRPWRGKLEAVQA